MLLYSVAYSFGGIPLLYMGDELALRNDAGYLADPERAPDNRWMHRPPMDWAAAARRPTPDTLEGRVFGWLRRLGEVRRALPALRGGGECSVLDVGNAAVLAWRRRHPRSGTFVGLANFSRAPQTVDADTVTGFGTLPAGADQRRPPELRDDRRAAARARLRLVRRALSDRVASRRCAGTREAVPSARGWSSADPASRGSGGADDGALSVHRSACGGRPAGPHFPPSRCAGPAGTGRRHLRRRGGVPPRRPGRATG